MGAKSVAIYTFSSMAYVAALFIYGNIRGPEFWDSPILYGYAASIVSMALVALWLGRQKTTKDDRVSWYVYVMLPLASPIVLIMSVCFWIAAAVVAVMHLFYD